MSNVSYIEATTLVKQGPGKLKGIFVSAASSTPTITVYDTQTSGTSDTVWVFSLLLLPQTTTSLTV